MSTRPGASAAALVVLLAPAALLPVGGCDTISSDFKDFTSGLTPPTPAQAAEWALDPYDAENRRRGTVLLSNAPWGGSEAYVKMYRDRVANETDAQVLAASITALGRHGAPGDARAIAAHLDDPSKEVRWSAAKALQRLHDPAVIEPLASRLIDENENADVRRSAAVALGQYPRDESFQALVASLDSRELGINLASRRSLEQLTGQDLGIDRVAWLNWYRDQKTPFVAQEPYLFPTYSRKLGWTDYVFFWDKPTFESPAPPAGLRDEGAKSTYDAPTPDAPTPPASTPPPDAPTPDAR